MCEINGQRYVTPSVFASGCGCNTQKITAACIDGRIIGACKDTSGKWIVPIDAARPLELEKIRELMVSSLYLKNKPDTVLDYSDQAQIDRLYTYLQLTGYIEPFDHDSKRIPYEVTLTSKGMKLATEGIPLSVNWLKIGSTVIQVCASLLTIIQSF